MMNKNKLLGLLEVLESTIVDGKRVPLTQNVIVNEPAIIDILDKFRLVINMIDENSPVKEPVKIDAQQALGQRPEDEAKKIKEGANEYAHYILSNLQLTVTKMQHNLVKLEKNIESGRNMIEEKAGPIQQTEQTIGKEIHNEYTF